MDSLGAVELRNAIAATFSVNLPATAVFDCPTSQALANHICAIISAPATKDAVNVAASQGHANDHSQLGRASRPRYRRQPFSAVPQKSGLTEEVALAGPSASDMETTVSRLVRDILGVAVDLQQPLMEVRCMACVVLKQDAHLCMMDLSSHVADPLMMRW